MNKKLWVPLIQDDRDAIVAAILYVKSLHIYEFISLNNDDTITVKDREGNTLNIPSPVPTQIITNSK